MTHILALLGGIAGAAAGFVIGLIAGGVATWTLGVTTLQGEASYVAVLGGLGMATFGLILGIMLVLHRRRRHRSLGALIAHTAAILVALCGIATAGVVARLALADQFDGPSPQLFFEIRLPSNAQLPERHAVRVELHTDGNSTDAILSDAWLRRDGDRAVIAGMVPLHLKTSKRTLVLALPDAPNRLFTIDLGRTPRVVPQFGDWRHVDFVDDRREAAGPRKPRRQDDFDIRIRVPDWAPQPGAPAPLAGCGADGRLCS